MTCSVLGTTSILDDVQHRYLTAFGQDLPHDIKWIFCDLCPGLSNVGEPINSWPSLLEPHGTIQFVGLKWSCVIEMSNTHIVSTLPQAYTSYHLLCKRHFWINVVFR